MLSSSSPVSSLFGVSNAREKLFAKLGIHNVYDLCQHFREDIRTEVIPSMSATSFPGRWHPA